MIEDVSQVMTKHITNILTGVIGEYTTYKETHDTIMGLPCVRKLQERIVELESGLGGRRVKGSSDDLPGSASSSGSREDEIAQLQSAIAEMNRYIIALESKVDVKTAYSSSSSSVASNRGTLEAVKEDEESVRLEIHEEEYAEECHDNNREDESSGQTFTVSSTHKNVIISTTDTEEEAEAEEAEAEEAEAEAEEEAEEAEEEAEAEEAEETEEESETQEAEEEEAEDEAEEAEAEEAEDEAEEEETEDEAEEAEEEAEAEEEEAEAAEEAEEEAEEAEEPEAEEPEAEEPEAEEEAEAEEAEIEVSEVKIKGKTYFTTDAVNGIIYACVDDDVGDEVGVFKNGVAVFNKGKK
jgi:hypothetical protein